MRDLRYAIRGLVRRPGFTAAAVFTLAVGIGATTATYSVVRGVLLRPLALDDPEHLVMIWGERPTQGIARAPISVGDLRDIREQVTQLEGVGAAWLGRQPVTGDGEAERVSVGFVTHDYLRLLRIAPVLGRQFEPDESSAALLGYGLWVRRYGADSSVVGRTIHLNGNPVTVIGVLPGDRNPNLTTFSGGLSAIDVYRVMPEQWLQGDDRLNGWIRLFGRVGPGHTVAQVQAELDALAQRIREQHPEKANFGFRLNAIPVLDDLVGDVRSTVLILFGAVVFVLLIACANVANLSLVRATARTRDMAVRAALGSSRGRIVRQLMTESGVLAVVGGVAGVALSLGAVRLLRTVAATQLPRVDEVTVDPPVLWFALGVVGVVTLLFGIAPAVLAARSSPMAFLRDHAPGATGNRLSRGLIVVEVALAMVLLVGAGLMLRSLFALRGVHPGFDGEGILTLAVSPPPGLNGGERAEFFEESLRRAESLPGVVAAGGSHRLPLAGGLWTNAYATERLVAEGAPKPEADYRFVTTNYLPAMGTRVLAGRGFAAGDSLDVVLVDRRMAEVAWPGEDPVGQRLLASPNFGDPAWVEVVGVVEHMRHEGLRSDGRETIFYHYSPRTALGHDLYVAVRTTGPPAQLTAALRAEIRAVGADATIDRVRTMRSLIGAAMGPERFALVLVSLFGLVAVTLAAVGLYGVISYSVSNRTREIGVRVAFGAGAANVLRLILGQGVTLVCLGVAVGVVAAVALTRVLRGLLFQVSPIDPVVYGAIGVTLLLVSLLATYLPARRALAIDPVEALRYE